MRNPAKGEQGSRRSLGSGPAKPRCVGSLARLPRRPVSLSSFVIRLEFTTREPGRVAQHPIVASSSRAGRDRSIHTMAGIGVPRRCEHRPGDLLGAPRRRSPERSGGEAEGSRSTPQRSVGANPTVASGVRVIANDRTGVSRNRGDPCASSRILYGGHGSERRSRVSARKRISNAPFVAQTAARGGGNAGLACKVLPDPCPRP